MWTPSFTTALGVVASSPLDWTHAQILPVFSCSAVVLGVVTSQGGTRIERAGPRASAALGSVLWSSALMATAAGVHCHSLFLVYLGWGALGGAGWGLLYLAPIGNLLRWFPDKRGLAAGVTLSAFGMGAALAPLPIHALLAHFAQAPEFVGPAAEVVLETLRDGTQVVSESSPLGEPGTAVVVATESDLLKFSRGGGASLLSPGAYAVSTGSTGAAPALAAMGAACGILGLAGSRFLAVPHPDWSPPPAPSSASAAHPSADALSKTAPTSSPPVPPTPPAPRREDVGLPVDYVTRKTVQFPLLWLSVFGNAAGGLALLTSSRVLFSDVWTSLAPSLVTPAFATAYAAALGAGMAGGRLGWSAVSDRIGRRQTYALFGLGIPVVGMAPALTHLAAAEAAAGDANALPLVAAFCGGSVLAATFYGGVFSVLPAYAADLFGPKNAGAVVGKLLTAFAASAVAGPAGLAYLRSSAEARSVRDLLGRVRDPDAFRAAFGCPLDDAGAVQALVDAKTVTIGRLVELAPPGTLDPTPFLYDTTCHAAAGLMCLALAANLLIRPIDVDRVLRELEQDRER
jgi:MFS family permease